MALDGLTIACRDRLQLFVPFRFSHEDRPTPSLDMTFYRFYHVTPVNPGNLIAMQPVLWRVQRSLFLAALALLVSASSHSQEVGTLTLLKDTPLHVIRGVSMLQGVEGMKLRLGDILETGPAATAQAQLEFSGGAVVELGPSSQLYIMSQTGGTADLVLLSGWLKGETTSGSYRYSSPIVSATTKGGNVLLHATSDASDAFVEHGTASVSGGGAAIPSSPDKIFFTHQVGKPLVPAERPSKDFIAGMPLSFRDVLPPRLSAFATKKPPVPKSDHDVSYAEVERWLMLPAAWRKGFAVRFKPRLQDNAFRQAITEHLKALPDWEPVLHPEDH
jgi:hypothetical protein